MASENNSKYRLVYFNLRSLGEPIRWILEYTGTPYVDERVPTDMLAWYTQRKAEFGNTVGQVPVLHEEGKREICQSHVISRYLASKTGLVGNNEWENAKIDEVISLLFDLYDSWRKAIVLEADAERKVQSKTTILDPKFSMYYAKFAKILEEEEGDFILGKKLTHADFWLAHLVSLWDDSLSGEPPLKMPPNFPPLSDADIFLNLTDEFPALKKHKQVVTSIPQIKSWISRRPKTML